MQGEKLQIEKKILLVKLNQNSPCQNETVRFLLPEKYILFERFNFFFLLVNMTI